MIIVYLSFVSYRQGRRQLTSSVSPFGALACTGTKLCKAADSFYAIYGRAQSGALRHRQPARSRASESIERARVQKWQDMPSQPPLEVVGPTQWYEVHTTVNRVFCVRVRERMSLTLSHSVMNGAMLYSKACRGMIAMCR